MFYKKEEIKRYKSPVIYVTKYENEDVEKLLDIIVRHIESYVKQENRMPDKLIFSENNFNRIMKYNNKLIENIEDKYYTFGVEVVIQKKRKIRTFNIATKKYRGYKVENK